ncbi:MAG: methionine biosynthesis protein MetW [Actinomycetota bacterium]|nr:methionine biosynthesis protein MetW [Actinomycetota bacterium]
MTTSELLRGDLLLIADLVPPGSRVLDLGCGDGALLVYLRDVHGCTVRGVELAAESVAACVARGLAVVQANLDDGLADFPDGAFDVVILSQTLQVVRRPALVVREMLRVGRHGIISFPNFAHWRVRAYLAFRGRMPVSRTIPYTWHETPNIHHTTLLDFREFCRANSVEIAQEITLRARGSRNTRRVRVLRNLLSETVVSVVESARTLL